MWTQILYSVLFNVTFVIDFQLNYDVITSTYSFVVYDHENYPPVLEKKYL